ncbi:MAG: pilus assembly PilX N-terminal domain-containing protein [Mariprofundaceae bacterium]
MVDVEGIKNERGFVLVTAMVLLGIMTGIGAISMYKSVISTKMSKSSADSAKAFEMANAGITRQFYEWGRDDISAVADSVDGNQKSFINFVNYLKDPANGAVSPIYSSTLYPPNLGGNPVIINGVSINSLEGFASGVNVGGCNASATLDCVDEFVRNGAPFRVFEMVLASATAGASFQKVANSQWGVGVNPQVAVWASSFLKVSNADDFPYSIPCDPTLSAATITVPKSCQSGDASIVLYALGRSDQSRRLVRELVSSTSVPQLEGVSAITNAPPYGTWQDACDMTDMMVSPSYGRPLTWQTPGTPDAVVEGTQAGYTRLPGDVDNWFYSPVPSGTLITSNADAGGGSNNPGKGFRQGNGSTTDLTMDSTPLLVYSGHGDTAATEGVRVDYADVALDTVGSDLPNGLLPKNLLRDSLLGKVKMNQANQLTPLKPDGSPADPPGEPVAVQYFIDANSQVFNLDAYRWGAEQFTCQGVSSNVALANGAYCDKSEALSYDGIHASTGRLSLEDFEYNVSNGYPMFGLVRVMYPTVVKTPNIGACALTGGSVDLFDVPQIISNIRPGNGMFIPYGNNSKIVVYGMLLIDYFTDYNGNGLFDADTERLITPIESVDAYLKISIPMMVNPAIPKRIGAPWRLASIAGSLSPSDSRTPANMLTLSGYININAAGSEVGLASPYDGWFPDSEGFWDPAGTDFEVGSMALMRLDQSGLVGASAEVQVSGGGIGGKAGALFAGERGRLDYYYKLLYQTTDQSDPNYWPMTDPVNFPASLGGNLCIGEKDCQNSNNNGDKFHLLFPSGYMHGWKVALAALDISADEWNNIYDGNGYGTTLQDLRDAHNVPRAYGDATHPKGSPFSQWDSGYNQIDVVDKIIATQASGSPFFKITKHSSGYGTLDSKFKDIPALCYSGGLIDTHSYNNVSGILYTPGPLEWETGNQGGKGYVNGAVIVGFGLYNKNAGGAGHQVYVFDPVATDNINKDAGSLIVMRRYGWQELF